MAATAAETPTRATTAARRVVHSRDSMLLASLKDTEVHLGDRVHVASRLRVAVRRGLLDVLEGARLVPEGLEIQSQIQASVEHGFRIITRGSQNAFRTGHVAQQRVDLP